MHNRVRCTQDDDRKFFFIDFVIYLPQLTNPPYILGQIFNCFIFTRQICIWNLIRVLYNLQECGRKIDSRLGRREDRKRRIQQWYNRIILHRETMVYFFCVKNFYVWIKKTYLTATTAVGDEQHTCAQRYNKKPYGTTTNTFGNYQNQLKVLIIMRYQLTTD